MLAQKLIAPGNNFIWTCRGLRYFTASTGAISSIVSNHARTKHHSGPNLGPKLASSPIMVSEIFAGSQQNRKIHFGPPCLSGSSHAHNIRHIKLKKDGEKAKTMSFLVKKIMSACKEAGGTDPKINRKLGNVLDECRNAKMSKETIQRTLDRAKNQKDKKVMISLKGPAGSYYILQCEVDSKGWMEKQIKKMLKTMPPGIEVLRGDVFEHFEQKGIIFVQKDKKEAGEDGEATRELQSLEEAEEIAIDIGAEEVLDSVDDSGAPAFEFICDIGVIQGVERALRLKNLGVTGSESMYRSLYQVKLNDAEKEIVGQFFDKLDDDEYVERIYDNIA